MSNTEKNTYLYAKGIKFKCFLDQIWNINNSNSVAVRDVIDSDYSTCCIQMYIPAQICKLHWGVQFCL